MPLGSRSMDDLRIVRNLLPWETPVVEGVAERLPPLGIRQGTQWVGQSLQPTLPHHGPLTYR